jgi:hypothetical protein
MESDAMTSGTDGRRIHISCQAFASSTRRASLSVSRARNLGSECV